MLLMPSAADVPAPVEPQTPPESPAPTEAQLAAAALAWLRSRVVVEWDEHAPLAGVVRVTGCTALPTHLANDPVVAPDDAIRALIGMPVASTSDSGVVMKPVVRVPADLLSAEELQAAMRASVPAHAQGLR